MADLVSAHQPIHIRHGSNIGQAMTRAEGALKVTGRATYAADNHPEGMLHAVMATSTIANGRVVALDVAAAEAHPGVVAVMTPANRPPLADDPDAKAHIMAFRLDVLQNDSVRYPGQAIAVVIAETLEAAREGAALLAPRYEAGPAITRLDDAQTFTPRVVGAGSPAALAKGDVEAGLAAAAHHIDATWDTPAQYHNPLEPHAIVVAWEGDALSIDMPTQGMAGTQARLAGLLGIAPEAIHIRSPFLGGGFGSKGMMSGPMLLGVLAARLTGRPVKLVLTRAQMYGAVSHRGATRQTLRLGSDAAGLLTALDHATVSTTSMFDEFLEPASNASNALYASPAIGIRHSGARLHTGTPGFMRAPGEATGSFALECAMDEAAFACGMDPLAFRLANYADTDPMSGKPFSSKELRACYEQGAARFGWAGRPLAPRTMRDEAGMLVGWGMGTAQFPALMFEGHARATLTADGRGLVEIGAHDMGQGAWTALAQIAADALALPIDQLEFRSGTSDLPDGGMAGGSAHTATAGMAIDNAGAAAIAELAALALRDPASPLYGAGNAGIDARDGRLVRRDDHSRGESFAEVLARAGQAAVVGNGSASGGGNPARGDRATFAHGAVFAEVKVDPELGQIRATRVIGAFAAGRIINPRMVDSQLVGGMIWGVSFALHEATSIDRRSGRVMNADLADYHIAVNADVPHVEAITVPEHDAHVNGLGIKGVGEIGITGTVGAIANAVWHATGVRVRRTPIVPADLMAGLG